MAVSGRSDRLIRGYAALLLLLAAAVTSAAASEKPGAFDYWILALSWGPQYCKSNPADPQCQEPHGFVVHGLWPQYETGYPDYCGPRLEQLPEDLEQRMLPLMPSVKLIRHQWRKHGSCSGYAPKEYFLQLERVYRRLVLPPELASPAQRVQTSPTALEQRFIELNPALRPSAIALQCRGRDLKEVWICLDRAFEPRACGREVDDRCRSDISIRALRATQQAR
ncbi:MAG: ribonuclease T2 [Nevskiales bacterium]|nr:ribonuclease T2 [Nevskiales bacterium]